MRGHKLAQLDPLEISSTHIGDERPQDLNYTFYNFRTIEFIEKDWWLFSFILFIIDENDLDRMFYLPASTFIGGNEKQLTLREIVRRLEVEKRINEKW